jgi:hypothetical protein
MLNSECRIEWRILNYSERSVNLLLTVYIVGVIIGLWRTDGPLPTKLTMALLWPIGPLAFFVTINGLLVAAVIAFSAPRRK